MFHARYGDGQGDIDDISIGHQVVGYNLRGAFLNVENRTRTATGLVYRVFYRFLHMNGPNP